jgi:division protein CdvB (Snf7/Vps24/ESCRT-III family)
MNNCVSVCDSKRDILLSNQVYCLNSKYSEIRQKAHGFLLDYVNPSHALISSSVAKAIAQLRIHSSEIASIKKRLESLKKSLNSLHDNSSLNYNY